MIPKKKVKKEDPSKRSLRVFSRHPSHRPLRNRIYLPFLACLRLGSTTEGTLPYKVELNSEEGVKNSSNKLLMKKCFVRDGVKTANWWIHNGERFAKVIGVVDNKAANTNEDMQFPIVAKHIYGSRGEGNYLLKSQEELQAWLKGKTLPNYIFEQYTPFVREYRLHLSELGCFYACRKMLKQDTPDNEKWHRHDNNSVWILEENEAFDKPVNWDEIVSEGVKAITAVGLDIGCIDLRVQSAKDSKGNARKNPEFFVIETNSAPSFGEVTLQKYLEHIPKLAKHKFVNK
jgi:hypothetical protein